LKQLFSMEMLKLLRLHHWLKNLLIFLIPLTGHMLSGYEQIFFGFVSLCLLASSIYIIDDVIDVKADRSHPVKKYRAIASGKISIRIALTASLFLSAISFYVASHINSAFLYILITYLITSLLYILVFKKIPILDVVLLTSFYLIRIFSGSLISGIPPGEWFTIFSVFLFLSLAILKRFIEVRMICAGEGKSEILGRGYKEIDLNLLQMLGLQCGLISILVLCQYINSDKVYEMYNHAEIIWFIVPMYLIWIIRIWFLANRGKVNYDPLLFTSKDIQSYLIGALILIVLFFAI